MAEEQLKIKKRKRTGHRASATRLVGQLKDNLEQEDGPDIPRLRQQRVSLTTKLDILVKLDDEILDMTVEDEIEQEIDLADQVRERLTLAISEIDHALDQAGELVTPSSVNAPPKERSGSRSPDRGSPTPPRDRSRSNTHRWRQAKSPTRQLESLPHPLLPHPPLPHPPLPRPLLRCNHQPVWSYPNLRLIDMMET